MKHLGSLENTQEARVTLTHLSCSPNFPRASYLVLHISMNACWRMNQLLIDLINFPAMLWLLLCLIRVHHNLFDVPTKKVIKYLQIYQRCHRRKRGVGEMWEESIYPGMKKAVISAVQSCQEIVEYRKVKWCLLEHKHSKQQHCILTKHDITETFVECTWASENSMVN